MPHLKRLLAPRGSVVIRTPVSSSFAWKKYGADWVQLDPPRHLFVPSVASLKALAATAALTVESILFDSTAFQFWASEQYQQGIALHDPRSYLQSPRGSVFSRDQIKEFTQLARELNNRAEGDQASFTLRAS